MEYHDSLSVTLSLEERKISLRELALQKLYALADRTRVAQGLTQAVALESVGVIGHNGLLNAYYGAGSAAQKQQIATEGIVDSIIDGVKAIFEVIWGIIAKALSWLKKLFFGEDAAEQAKTIVQTKDTLKKLGELVQHASSMQDATKIKTALAADKSDEKFLHGLSPTEVATLFDIKYVGALEQVWKEFNSAFGQGKSTLAVFKELLDKYRQYTNGAEVSAETNQREFSEAAKKAIGAFQDETTGLDAAFERAAKLKDALPKSTELKPDGYKAIYAPTQLLRLAQKAIEQAEQMHKLNVGGVVSDLEAVEKEMRKASTQILADLKKWETGGQTAFAQIARELADMVKIIPQRAAKTAKAAGLVKHQLDALSKVAHESIRHVKHIATVLNQASPAEDLKKIIAFIDESSKTK